MNIFSRYYLHYASNPTYTILPVLAITTIDYFTKDQKTDYSFDFISAKKFSRLQRFYFLFPRPLIHIHDWYLVDACAYINRLRVRRKPVIAVVISAISRFSISGAHAHWVGSLDTPSHATKGNKCDNWTVSLITLLIDF